MELAHITGNAKTIELLSGKKALDQFRAASVLNFEKFRKLNQFYYWERNSKS